jgi:hypothetical protein
VHVGDVRSPFCDRLPDFVNCPKRVDRIKRKPHFLCGAERSDLVIVPAVKKDSMPVALEKFLFGKSYCVFAPELLIEIVDEKNIHVNVKQGCCISVAAEQMSSSCKSSLADVRNLNQCGAKCYWGNDLDAGNKEIALRYLLLADNRKGNPSSLETGRNAVPKARQVPTSACFW